MLSRRLNWSLTALNSSADVITPMVCTDVSPVQPVLKTWLLHDLHRLWNTVRPFHRCPFLDRRFILCFTCCFTWCPEAQTRATQQGIRSSDNHRMHRCYMHRFFWCSCFLQNSSNSAFLWVLSSCIVLYGLFSSSLGSRNVHLTKQLVSLIALSYDHQNHSKWHKWCHVRYSCAQQDESGLVQLKFLEAWANLSLRVYMKKSSFLYVFSSLHCRWFPWWTICMYY